MVISAPRALTVLSVTTLIFLLTGCGVITRGVIYTDTTQPLCKDARGTIIGNVSSRGSSKRLQIPTTRVDIGAEWDSRAIGDIAREHGMKTVYTCDARRQSILFGLWRRDEVIIYGE